jgi:hypothetical protein
LIVFPFLSLALPKPFPAINISPWPDEGKQPKFLPFSDGITESIYGIKTYRRKRFYGIFNSTRWRSRQRVSGERVREEKVSDEKIIAGVGKCVNEDIYIVFLSPSTSFALKSKASSDESSSEREAG